MFVPIYHMFVLVIVKLILIFQSVQIWLDFVFYFEILSQFQIVPKIC
jgi:hypothetical protein